jgi:hypothetical protein
LYIFFLMLIIWLKVIIISFIILFGYLTRNFINDRMTCILARRIRLLVLIYSLLIMIQLWFTLILLHFDSMITDIYLTLDDKLLTLLWRLNMDLLLNLLNNIHLLCIYIGLVSFLWTNHDRYSTSLRWRGNYMSRKVGICWSERSIK